MTCSTTGQKYFWAMYNGTLIIYPKATTASTLEIIGVLKPASYTESDLNKEMVKVIADTDTEIQGLSDEQLKLVRYKVITRLCEDNKDYELADRFEMRAKRIEREMQIDHKDDGFTESTGQIGIQ